MFLYDLIREVMFYFKSMPYTYFYIAAWMEMKISVYKST